MKATLICIALAGLINLCKSGLPPEQSDLGDAACTGDNICVKSRDHHLHKSFISSATRNDCNERRNDFCCSGRHLHPLQMCTSASARADQWHMLATRKHHRRLFIKAALKKF
ncbi:hypothetical protein V5799_027718 [Amblyomma americanum]|uniref:Secreted protein n=1 Tax=Amblyomma americanum TaxID=6943 RepID=A0AAQ4DEX4_AMBAM